VQKKTHFSFGLIPAVPFALRPAENQWRLGNEKWKIRWGG
jgi:hypothetical protein